MDVLTVVFTKILELVSTKKKIISDRRLGFVVIVVITMKKYAVGENM